LVLSGLPRLDVSVIFKVESGVWALVRIHTRRERLTKNIFIKQVCGSYAANVPQYGIQQVAIF